MGFETAVEEFKELTLSSWAMFMLIAQKLTTFKTLFGV